MAWTTVTLDPWTPNGGVPFHLGGVPFHLRITVNDLIAAHIDYAFVPPLTQTTGDNVVRVTPHVADVILLWNKAAQDDINNAWVRSYGSSLRPSNQDAYGRSFGGITRVQFIDEYLKPAWEMDLKERVCEHK